ncbi:MULTISPECIES: paraquat-inducible protein A [Burkholderia]|uniref:Paraquat-inducible protein A n=2 Tax=Burkholderia TaxID=32008 RepID=A0A6J5J4N9_9BURK|nr:MULTISPECIES: paraquat-inducible protein A [Burkholderia]CAB3966582.1 paraquat-inducible protein A [Burkholderia aenigmatica]VWC56964.1 paraquat-inducible protein A [Burkholderia aenigmatica]VWC81250.1 paraquat-inducible protein A [Burkholderia aenigmatica]
MSQPALIVCHTCDAVLNKPRLAGKATARCPRCNERLYRGHAAQLDRICALTLAALIAFAIAQCFPILEMNVSGMHVQTTLTGALDALWRQDMRIVAVMVFCSALLFPLVELAALLYLLAPLRAGRIPPAFDTVLRAIQLVRPWGMIEVFMLGILVTIVKMVSLAQVVPEAALFAFATLTLLLAVAAAFDPRALWDVADALRERAAGGPARRATAR